VHVRRTGGLSGWDRFQVGAIFSLAAVNWDDVVDITTSHTDVAVQRLPAIDAVAVAP
jgi:hypothetical protein